VPDASDCYSAVIYRIDRGANIHTRTSDGLSAIDMAKTLKDAQLLRILGVK